VDWQDQSFSVLVIEKLQWICNKEAAIIEREQFQVNSNKESAVDW
jgi:hypothetical protein